MFRRIPSYNNFGDISQLLTDNAQQYQSTPQTDPFPPTEADPRITRPDSYSQPNRWKPVFRVQKTAQPAADVLHRLRGSIVAAARPKKVGRLSEPERQAKIQRYREKRARRLRSGLSRWTRKLRGRSRTQSGTRTERRGAVTQGGLQETLTLTDENKRRECLLRKAGGLPATAHPIFLYIRTMPAVQK